MINSLFPGRWSRYLKNIISELIIQNGSKIAHGKCHRTSLMGNEKSTFVQVQGWCSHSKRQYLNPCWPSLIWWRHMASIVYDELRQLSSIEVLLDKTFRVGGNICKLTYLPNTWTVITESGSPICKGPKLSILTSTLWQWQWKWFYCHELHRYNDSSKFNTASRLLNIIVEFRHSILKFMTMGTWSLGL